MLLLNQETFLLDLFYHRENDPDVIPFGFEANFIKDMDDRYGEEGVLMFMSGRMMNIIRRIGRERYGMEWVNYVDE
jgi:hypothetical protein